MTLVFHLIPAPGVCYHEKAADAEERPGGDICGQNTHWSRGGWVQVGCTMTCYNARDLFQASSGDF